MEKDKYMTVVEKWKFLDTIKYDSYFKREFFDILMGNDFIRNELVEKIIDKLYYNLSDDIVSAVTNRILNDMGEDWANDLEENLKDDIETKILLRKDSIKKEIVDGIARNCLSISDKEELKKKVEKIMIKKRSYRSDIIDLDE